MSGIFVLCWRFWLPLLVLMVSLGLSAGIYWEQWEVEKAWEKHCVEYVASNAFMVIGYDASSNLSSNTQAFAGLPLSEKYLMVQKAMEDERNKTLHRRARACDRSLFVPFSEVAESARYTYGAANRQRGLAGPSLGALVAALGRVEEFRRRIGDSGDLMADIDEYADLLYLPGFAGRLYWEAQKLYFAGEYKKAENCMEFFRRKECSDEFVRGASTYFRGRLYERAASGSDWREMMALALGCYLKVPQLATCLTYISYSYIEGAKTAAALGDLRTALALCMVDVPSVDKQWVNYRRHVCGAEYAYLLGRHTNSLRHVQGVLKTRPEEYEHSWYERVPIDEKAKRELWEELATNCWDIGENQDIVVDALTNAIEEVDYDDLLAVLAIDWPKSSDLPLAVATNRVLNNKYFKVERKKSLEGYRRRR